MKNKDLNRIVVSAKQFVQTKRGELKPFVFYCDYVVELARKLQALWIKHLPPV
jgi:hypothetical protein